MNAALWLLIGLQLRGRARRTGRGLRTLRGAVQAAAGASLFVLFVASVFLPRSGRAPADPDALRRDGPAFLLAYCLVSALTTAGEGAVYFSPAEICFLFPGPFSRRQVLAYKLTSNFVFGVLLSLFYSLAVQAYSPSYASAFVGVLLGLSFTQLFGVAVNLTVTTLGTRLYSRVRRVLAAALFLAAAVFLAHAAGVEGARRPRDLLVAALRNPAGRAAVTPLRWFFEVFTAERFWPDLVGYSALAVLVNLVLAGVVFALDARYLESAAASSARIYDRLQRLRRGGMAAGGTGGTARFGLPGPPQWGGVGPIFWRQLTTAVRGLGRLAVVLGLVAVFAGWPALAGAREGGLPAGTVLGVLVVWMTLFLTQLVPFDFRGDVDRMAVLKALPVAPWRLAVGQLLTPVLLVTILQWAAFAAVAALGPSEGGFLLACAAFALPFNFLLFGVENLLFLRFPTRVVASSPGDFQSTGRNLLLMMARLLAIGVTAGVAAVAGLTGYVLTLYGLKLLAAAGAFAASAEGATWAASRLAGGAAAWLAVAAGAAVLVPLIARAFTAFDVGRDTPP